MARWGGSDERLVMPGEEWRNIVGVPGYQVSNLGRVKSLARISRRFTPRWGCENPLPVKEKIRKQCSMKYRYTGKNRIRDDRPTAMLVGFVLNGKLVSRYVHHLVLEAFVGLRPQGTEACHSDGDATNNRLDNLRWDTSESNKADAIRLGQFWPILRKKGEVA